MVEASSKTDSPSAKSVATVSFVTMGCAKNEVDSAHMANRLSQAGYSVVDDVDESDVIIVNTCSFIQAATEESIEAILDATELDRVKSGKAHVVVSGCMPARYEGDLEGELPEVSRFVSCSQEQNIVQVLDDMLGIERFGDLAQSISAPPIEMGDVSAYVKISDGCDRFCSYCTIPFIRGRYHSFTLDEITAEVQRLVEAGAREIVLIAQDTGRWGDDFETPSSLAELLESLARRFPQTWFRVMYIQPEGITDELIDVVAAHDNVCSYFDIPFQHCDRSLLKAMNRNGSGREFLDLIGRIRSQIPNVTLRTTLIAGFPGETDEQFEDLCDFVEEAELDYVGVFAYSREEGTRAYKLEGQIDEDEKLFRAQQLRDRADAVSSTVVARRIGRSLDVLVCGQEEDGQRFGRAQCQAPDVDGVTYVPSGEPGDIVSVTIDDTLLYEMEGE